MANLPRCLRMTKGQEDLLLREYAMLPRRPDGIPMPGVVNDLARKWRVSRAYISRLNRMRGGKFQAQS